MTTLCRSELFWNAPYRFPSTRAVDPLGFDALREAMSNDLVPFLNGAPTHAEHYVTNSDAFAVRREDQRGAVWNGEGSRESWKGLRGRNDAGDT